MAKEKAGWMARNIGEADTPVAPNFGLIEQAGAHRGTAARIAGESDAATIKALGEMGTTAYQTYQYTESAKEAREVMERLQSPTWQGKKAFEAEETLRGVDALTLGNKKQAQEEFGKIVDAAKNDAITPERAQAELAAAMRKRIAANPGAAASIRAAYNEFSGQGNWDISEMQRAFQSGNAAADEQKRLLEQAKTIPAGFRAIVNEKGETVGAFTDADYAQAFKTQSGPAWNSVLSYYNHERQKAGLVALETAAKTEGVVSERQAIGVNNAVSIGREAAMHSVDIKFAGQSWEGLPPDKLVEGMATYRTEMQNSWSKFKTQALERINAVKDPVAQAAMIKHLDEQDKLARSRIDGITKDTGEFLSHMRTMSSITNDKAQGALANAQMMDKLIGFGFTSSEIDRMKNENGRREILESTKNDPSNPMRKMVVYFDQLRTAVASGDFNLMSSAMMEGNRLQKITTTADALAKGEKVVDGKPIDPTDPDTIAAVKLREERAAQAAKKDVVDLSDKDVVALRETAPDLSDKESSIDSFLAFFRSGKIDKVDKGNAEFIRTNVANRMQQWLMGDEQVHYPARLATVLKNNQMQVDASGNLTIKVGRNKWNQAGDAARLVSRANKMLELASAASGIDKKELAQQVLEKTKSYSPAKQGDTFSASFTEEDIMRMGPETAKASLRKMGVPSQYIDAIVKDMEATRQSATKVEQPKKEPVFGGVKWGDTRGSQKAGG